MHLLPIAKFVVQSAVVLLAALTLLSFLGGSYWVFDLIAQWRVQLAGSALLGVFALAAIRRFVGGRSTYLPLAFVLLLANSYPVVAFFRAPPPAPITADGAGALRVMTLNVQKQNDRFAAVIADITREDPDVLLLLEIDRRWLEAMTPLSDRYPHRIAVPKSDRFGMALFSKTAFTAGEIKEWGKYRIPYIAAAIRDARDTIVHVLAVHTLTPLCAECAADGHDQSRHMMQMAARMAGPVVLLGDWNRTPWSNSYRMLMREFDLVNTAGGGFPSATWRPNLLGGLAIDHVFVKNMRAGNWHIGRPVGSDHRAVIVDVQAK